VNLLGEKILKPDAAIRIIGQASEHIKNEEASLGFSQAATEPGTGKKISLNI